MKKIILAAAVMLGFLSAPQKTSAQEVSFGLFYSSLAPYGQWVNAGGYGMSWRPAGVPADWRPYTFGHWVWTDYGWTWVSGYPWGWAPFHYGRWVLDSYYGWIWVPGYVWAPAWVQWRWGGGYCGWAPLPPGFHFRVDVVIGPDDRDFGVGLRGWNFVRADEMGRPHYRFLDRDAVPRVIGSTRNVTRFRFTAKGVFDIGLQRTEVERVTRRKIATVNIFRTNEVTRQRVIGNSIHIYSPAPFAPRFRNEDEVIRRERVYRAPERVKAARPEARPGPRHEAPQPRVRQERQVPRFQRQKEDSTRPRHEVQKKVRDNPGRHDGNSKDKGPGRRH